MTVTVYYDEDNEQILKVDGEFRSYKTAAEVRNLLQEAYSAGFRRDGFIVDNQIQHA